MRRRGGGRGRQGLIRAGVKVRTGTREPRSGWSENIGDRLGRQGGEGWRERVRMGMWETRFGRRWGWSTWKTICVKS